MSNEIFAQFAALTAPAKKFNTLAVANLEKLTDLQLNAARAYVEIGVEQMRAALNVSDAKSLQDYVAGQSKVAKTVSEKLTADTTALVELSKNFGSEVQKLAQESVASLNVKAA